MTAGDCYVMINGFNGFLRKIDHHKSELRRYEKELKELQYEKENFIRQYHDNNVEK